MFMQYGKHVVLSSILSATLLVACGGGGGGGSSGGSAGGTDQPPPSGRSFYVYATNDRPTGQDTISIFSADSNIGELRPAGSINAGPNPAAITVVNNKFVYVANNGAVVPNGVSDPGSISAYSINASTGALTPITGSPYTGVHNATSVKANNGVLYATNFEGAGSVSGYRIDANTGALTLLGEYNTNFGGTNGATPASIAFSADGRFAYTANKSHTNSPNPATGGDGTVTVFDVNATTGELTAKQNLPAGVDPIAVTVIGQSLYVANNQLAGPQNNVHGNVTMFTIAGDGTLSGLTAYDAGITPQAVVGDSSTVYVATSGTGNVTRFARAANGTLSSPTGMAVVNTPWNLTIDPSGRFLYVANNAVGADGGVSGFLLQPGTAPRALPFAATPNVSAVAATAVMP